MLHALLSGKSGAGAQQAPSLTQLFHVGQFVRCIVTSLGGGGDDGGVASRKSVGLSLRLRKVMAGQEGGAGAVLVAGAAVPAVVRSAEDHGFTLGFGIKVGLGRGGLWLYECVPLASESEGRRKIACVCAHVFGLGK